MNISSVTFLHPDYNATSFTGARVEFWTLEKYAHCAAAHRVQVYYDRLMAPCALHADGKGLVRPNGKRGSGEDCRFSHIGMSMILIDDASRSCASMSYVDPVFQCMFT